MDPGLVGRVGAVLRAVAAHEPGGARTSDVALSSGLARPTVHRLLSSMLEEGLTDRSKDGKWLLGPELYLLGTAAAARYDLADIAQPFVRQLARASGESAFFSARRGDETVCLVREDGDFPIRSHVLHEGIRFPLGVASAGLAILAFLPGDEQVSILERSDLESRYGANHRPSAIHDRLVATRRDGYSVHPGLLVTGSRGMGAAVFDAAGPARMGAEPHRHRAPLRAAPPERAGQALAQGGASPWHQPSESWACRLGVGRAYRTVYPPSLR